MNSLIAFTNKEIKEQLRTYKTLIIMTVLLLFGITSPIFAKIMPDLIGNMELGYEIKMPLPTYLDAFGQFFRNMTQVGMIIVILVFSGTVSQEKTKGTILLMLTKRISRTSFILSKFLSMVLLFTGGYILSAVTCLFYTVYLFEEVKLEHALLSFFTLWLFMVLVIAITLFASTCSSNSYIGTIGAFAGWFALMMTTYVPKVKDVTPLVLSTWNIPILKGIKALKDLSLPILVSVLCIGLLLALTCSIFKKQEI